VALLCRFLGSDVGLLLLVLEAAVPVVSVHRDQHPTAGIDNPVGARPAAEAAEHLRMDNAEPGASQHRNRQFRHHRHVQSRAITGLQAAEIPQQGSEFTHSNIQLLIGDMLCRLALQFRYKMDGGLVLVLRQMPIDAVVAGIDPATDKPSPKRSITGIESFVPTSIPVQEVSVLVEAPRKVVETEPFVNLLVGQVCLGNELLWRIVVFFFLPMDRNFGFRHIGPLFHSLAPEKTMVVAYP